MATRGGSMGPPAGRGPVRRERVRPSFGVVPAAAAGAHAAGAHAVLVGVVRAEGAVPVEGDRGARRTGRGRPTGRTRPPEALRAFAPRERVAVAAPRTGRSSPVALNEHEAVVARRSAAPHDSRSSPDAQPLPLRPSSSATATPGKVSAAPQHGPPSSGEIGGAVTAQPGGHGPRCRCSGRMATRPLTPLTPAFPPNVG